MRGILLGLGLMVLSFNVSAQHYENGIGLRGGGSNGITFKHFFNETNGVEMIVSPYPNDLAVFLLYERQRQIGDKENLHWYYGAGGHAAFDLKNNTIRTYGPDGENVFFVDRKGFGVGVDGIIGVEYSFMKIPLAISLDVKPYVEFNTDENIYFSPDPGLGIKVTF